MLFNSLTYLVFLAAATAAYWLLPQRWKNIFVLAASLFFYCFWDWRYGALFVGSMVGNFYLGRWVHGSAGRWRLAIAVALNLAVLGYFKYLAFFARSVNGALDAAGSGL